MTRAGPKGGAKALLPEERETDLNTNVELTMQIS